MIQAVIAAAAIGSTFNADLETVSQDLAALPSEVRTQARYITVGSLPVDQQDSAMRVCSYLLNSMAALSHGDISQPRVVGDHIIRFYIGQYAHEESYDRWATAWDTMIETHPQSHFTTEFIAQDTNKITTQVVAGGWLPVGLVKQVQQASGCTMPLLDIHHWLSQVTQSSVYYQHLGAQDVDTVLSLLGVDTRELIALHAQRAATVRRSRVALGKPRRIVEYRGPFGGNWITFDVKTLEANNDAVRNPLSVVTTDQGEALRLIEFDASEYVLSGRNGLPVFLISDADGALQDFVPPEVAHDFSEQSTNFDHLIRAPIGCIRCHTDQPGFNAYEDHQKVLSSYGQLATTQNIASRIHEIYNAPQLQRRLTFDSDTFSIATHQATGWTWDVLSNRVGGLYRSAVLNDLEQESASVEIGVDVETLNGLSRAVADPYLLDLANGRSIPRSAWQASLHLLLSEREKHARNNPADGGNDALGLQLNGGRDEALDRGGAGRSSSVEGSSSVALRNSNRIPGRELRGSVVSAGRLRSDSDAVRTAESSDDGSVKFDVRSKLPVRSETKSSSSSSSDDTGDDKTSG